MRDKKTHETLVQLCAAMNAAGISPHEAVNCAGEFLATVLMTACESEKHAHEALNCSVESGHEYINANWRDTMRMREEQEKRSR